MTHRLTGMPHQPHHAALGYAVPLSYLGGGCPAYILSHQSFDRRSVKPLANPPLPATATSSGWSGPRLIHDVRQQRGVQFESS
jgi:hypothetical protein